MLSNGCATTTLAEVRSPQTQAGFYGIQLSSLLSSVQEVLACLDPETARRARDCYSCFDPFRR